MPSWQVEYRRTAPGSRRSTVLVLADSLTEAAGNVLRPGLELLAVRPARPAGATAVGDVLTTAAQLIELPDYAVIVATPHPDDPGGMPEAWQKWDSNEWQAAGYWAEQTAEWLVHPRRYASLRLVWLPGNPAPA